MVLAVGIAAWLALAVVGVTVMRRRGHDTFSWALLFTFLGPLAIPLAVSTARHPAPDPPGDRRHGTLDVLVAHDGSPDASSALRSVLELLADRVTSLTLAEVVDAEAVTTVRGRETVAEAQARLDGIAAEIEGATSGPIETVVLHGEPAGALERYAADNGFNLIVAGSKGKRNTPFARRSKVAKVLARGSAVPVLIGPVPR